MTTIWHKNDARSRLGKWIASLPICLGRGIKPAFGGSNSLGKTRRADMENEQGRGVQKQRQLPIIRALFAAMMAALTPVTAFGQAVDVLTQHNDLTRSGADLSEYVLTTCNVNTSQFGLVFTRAVDGQIYAQPLYMNSLTISNQTRNVVYVCTEHNSVYAFDADNPATSNALWQVNLGRSVPTADIDNCGDIKTEVGITSTPVIDPVSQTLYVEAKALNGTNIFHSLHGLDLVTGLEKFGGPVTIQATVPGTGDGGTSVTFNAQHQLNRPGLLLLSNVVYAAFGSHCDWDPYHGWLIGYSATNLQEQVSVYNTTPNGNESAIWSCGMGPAADNNGNIYVMTGNGIFDANTGGTELGESFIKLTPSNGTLVVTDWFSPHDEATLSAGDLDLGSGGPILLPTNLVVGIGKTGTLYVVDCNNMGHFVPDIDTNAVQAFTAAPQSTGIGQSSVYWNGPTNQFFYLWSGSTPLQAFDYTGTNLVTPPLATGNTVQSERAGGMSLSANHNVTGSGIIWGIESGNNGTIHAYDAENVSQELWNSEQNPARDALGNYTKFCAPTIANGKVYVPTTSNQLVVYGLLQTPYQLWKQQYFTSDELTNAAISGDLADPAGDGIPNLEKYAFGLNPLVSTNGASLTVGSVQSVGGTNYLSITFKTILYNTDISYTVQVSGDLVNWFSGAGYTTQVGTPLDNGDGSETVTVLDNVAMTAATARFIRLSISLP